MWIRKGELRRKEQEETDRTQSCAVTLKKQSVLQQYRQNYSKQYKYTHESKIYEKLQLITSKKYFNLVGLYKALRNYQSYIRLIL